ncbi:hypothetical protein SAMN05216188_102744 [Lentzea xinjiangensis]|uniref:Uncharacterized protein n=1 Tax=Lentzea xinjiangensis TaxID=402600 RepID=A0A1H9F152_9PSEU|nr:hypothetical protein SAMN05216188_102744 [Lentzea xinjiangensis]
MTGFLAWCCETWLRLIGRDVVRGRHARRTEVAT